MPEFRHERMTSAFILLFLAEKQGCGVDLLKKLEKLVPGARYDSAIIYRSLKMLEKGGMVNFEWLTPETGPAKKNYTITEKGLETLAEQREAVDFRLRSLNFFTKSYDKLKKEGRL